MNAVRELYRRLDLLQSTFVFRVVASIVMVLVVGAIFLPLIISSNSLTSQRDGLFKALVGQSTQNNDEFAVSLFENGTMHWRGRDYGGEWFRDEARFGFDEQGNITSPAWLATRLVEDQRPTWAPAFLVDQAGTTQLLAIVTAGSLLLVVWLNLTLAFVIAAIGAFLIALPFWLGGSENLMLAAIGIPLLSFCYMLFSRAMMVVLSVRFQPLAVAHTVVKEASRSKLSLFFIALFVVLLPLVPLRLDPEAPLRYRVQTFLSTSLDLTYYIAALMTLFLACATVSFEIRDKQIWQLMSKPVGRFNYLLGKWIGVLSVNIVILLVSGVSVFVYVQWLRQLPVAPGVEGQFDRLAVEDEVLTARVGIVPDEEFLTAQQEQDRVNLVIERDPELSQLENVDAATRRKILGEIREQYSLQQRSIPAARGREYVFSGLKSAKQMQSTLALRYKFYIGRSDEHERFDVAFEFNKDPNNSILQTYVPTMTHTLPIGSHLIRDDGTMSLTVYNAHRPTGPDDPAGAMMFDPGGIELLFRVGNFEPNFFRALFGMWIKLSFLAMLGVASATLLSFPVACLFAFTIFLGGTIAPFLADSLKEYYPPDMTSASWSSVSTVIQWAFESTIRGIAQAIVFMLDSFGQFTPQTLLVEGRLVSWYLLFLGLMVIGVGWSGLALILGYLVFRKRELATYSGQS